MQDRVIRALGQFDLLVPAVARGFEFEIGVRQHTRRIARAVERVAQHAEQFLHFGAAHVRPFAENVIEVMLVEAHARFVLEPLAYFLLSDPDDLWLDEGSCRTDLRQGAGGLPVHLRSALVGGVHRTGQGRIHLHFGGALGQGIYLFHDFDKRIWAIAEMSLELFERSQATDKIFYFGIELLRRLEHAFGVPGLVLFDFGSRQGVGHGRSPFVEYCTIQGGAGHVFNVTS